MNVFSLFRISVVAPIVLIGIGIAYAILAESSFSQEWRDIIAWNGYGGIFFDDLNTASIWRWIAIGSIGLVALIRLINQFLLFFYWKPSRIIFSISCIIFYPTLLICGLSVLNPIEYFLYEVSTFLSGITLALAYYSPVARRFR